MLSLIDSCFNIAVTTDSSDAYAIRRIDTPKTCWTRHDGDWLLIVRFPDSLTAHSKGLRKLTSGMEPSFQVGLVPDPEMILKQLSVCKNVMISCYRAFGSSLGTHFFRSPVVTPR